MNISRIGKEIISSAIRFFRFRSRRESQRGMALIFVLSLVGVIMAVMGEVFFQAQITVRSSNGEQDRMRAEAAALTGAQFALFLIALEAQVNDVGENKNLPPAL
ncbi:MAG: hypothetical protein RI932_2389, partial [Pseudomonadota bacterium]